MLPQLTLVLPVLVFLSCFIPCCTASASNERNASISESKSVDDQVTLSAELPERLMVNEEWPLRVTVRNVGRERLTLSLRKGVRSDVMVEVRNGHGRWLERTAFGKRHLPGQLLLQGRYVVDNVISDVLKHLEPGDSYTWQIELGKCFDFAPGEYTVEISVPVEPLGRIRHEVHIDFEDRTCP